MKTEELKRNMETECKLVKLLEKQLERTNYWLSFAEGKHGALLAINTVIIAAVFNASDKMSLCIVNLIIYGFISSCVVCLYALYPNMKSEDSSNLLYYLNISKIKTGNEYAGLAKKKYSTGTDNIEYNALGRDLAEEIIINSKIAVFKYQLFRIAVIIDIITLVVTGILLYKSSTL